ncbi:hypothetical protein TRAPUB_13089 [Trametes pubescens]|uniref:Uncharacterized protein n=1 Tax=Trametes pubescens TaxID=154538 RepID=A0A1M2VS30_TRAPU|nr:hypothetical protein TRAPUB_13089 [Trametes pubescens]
MSTNTLQAPPCKQYDPSQPDCTRRESDKSAHGAQIFSNEVRNRWHDAGETRAGGLGVVVRTAHWR